MQYSNTCSTWLDFSANCLRRASLFCCFLSSSWRVWSRWGTRVLTSFHLDCTSFPAYHKEVANCGMMLSI